MAIASSEGFIKPAGVHRAPRGHPRSAERVHWLLSFYRSTVGKKVLMALTGIIGVGFIMLHVSLNLLAYGGPAGVNGADQFLKSTGGWLWLARAILLTAVVVHILLAYQLWRISRSSRPTDYQEWEPVGSNIASRTMRWTGSFLAVFIALHVLQMTTPTLNPRFLAEDVYHDVITAFQMWYVSALYIASMCLLGLHVYHGAWSMFQSLGFNQPHYQGWIRPATTTVTVLVVLGFISIPVGVLLGVLA